MYRCIKPCKSWDKLTTSTGEQDFFHQQQLFYFTSPFSFSLCHGFWKVRLMDNSSRYTIYTSSCIGIQLVNTPVFMMHPNMCLSNDCSFESICWLSNVTYCCSESNNRLKSYTYVCIECTLYTYVTMHWMYTKIQRVIQTSGTLNNHLQTKTLYIHNNGFAIALEIH